MVGQESSNVEASSTETSRGAITTSLAKTTVADDDDDGNLTLLSTSASASSSSSSSSTRSSGLSTKVDQGATGGDEETPQTTGRTTHFPQQGSSTSDSHVRPLSARTSFASTITPAPQIYSTEITRPPQHPHPPSTQTQGGTTATNTNSHSHGSSQSIAAILFETLGGLLGLCFVLGFGRCAYKYHRTPPRDRISALLDRHQLERELAELEAQEAMDDRRSSIVAPPPPYERAPSYEQLETVPNQGVEEMREAG